MRPPSVVRCVLLLFAGLAQGCHQEGLVSFDSESAPASATVFNPELFPQDTRLDRDSAGVKDSYLPQICCEGSQVCVVWEDLRNGAWDIYFNRSTDGGGTWMPQDVRLDTSAAGSSSSLEPTIACSGQNV